MLTQLAVQEHTLFGILASQVILVLQDLQGLQALQVALVPQDLQVPQVAQDQLDQLDQLALQAQQTFGIYYCLAVCDTIAPWPRSK